MKTINMCCNKCNKFRKLMSPKLSYIFDKTLIISIICNKFCNNNRRMFKKEYVLRY